MHVTQMVHIAKVSKQTYNSQGTKAISRDLRSLITDRMSGGVSGEKDLMIGDKG